MARPTREAVDTYMSITGASEPLAFQKLEEYGGDLHDAVSAYFGEQERLITNPAPAVPPQANPMDRNHHNRGGLGRLLPLLSVARNMRASSLFDPNFRRNVSQACSSAFTGHTSSISHPVDARGVPLDFRASGQHSGDSDLRPTFAEIVRPTSSHYPEIHGNAVSEEEYFPSELSGQNPHDRDVEEEMIKAAIEASKREDPSCMGISRSQLDLEDDVLAQAISLSLKTAEEEKAMHKQHDIDTDQELGVYGLNETSEKTADGRWKWGGITSEELDEAVMLESALFDEKAIPKGTSGHFPNEPHPQITPDRTIGPSLQSVSSPSSPSLMDDKYLGTQMHGRETEFSMRHKAETGCSKEYESCGEMCEEELGRRAASLPPEPALDDENAVYLLVKMPNGSRHGRRFLKSDKLKFFFDFIDSGGLVKPGTYRVVRPYPRCTFGVDSGSQTLGELGFTSKQEALYLEII